MCSLGVHYDRDYRFKTTGEFYVALPWYPNVGNMFLNLYDTKTILCVTKLILVCM